MKENDNGKPIQTSWIPECPVPIEKLFAMLERSSGGVEAHPPTRTQQEETRLVRIDHSSWNRQCICDRCFVGHSFSSRMRLTLGPKLFVIIAGV